MFLNILTKISWQDYLLVVVAALIAYYVFVAFKFYSQEVKEIVTGGSHGAHSVLKQTHENHHTSQKNQYEDYSDPEQNVPAFEDTPDATFELVERLISTLKIIVKQSADKEFTKEEFSERLTKIFGFYPDLKYSQFQPAIHELIISECEKLEYIPISEDELMELW